MMNIKRILAMGLAVCLLALALASCGESSSSGSAAGDNTATFGDTESDLDYVMDKGTLVIGYTVYEPMNYTDSNNEFTGFDTEFARAVCEKLGVTPDFVEINWDTKIAELKSKTIDCIWNGMTITDELQQNIAISEPYVLNKQVLVCRSEDADTYKDTANLAGKGLVVEAGSAGETVATSDENLKQADLIKVTKQTDALMEIESGTADAAVFDWTLAQNMIGEGTDFADLVVVATLKEENYGIGFRQGSDLCDRVNEIIKELVADGTLPALAEKYDLDLAPEITQ